LPLPESRVEEGYDEPTLGERDGLNLIFGKMSDS
jgi:hypothetical protein